MTATLLVVDDEPHMRLLVTRILSNAGYQVFQAAHGAEALEVLLQHPEIRLVVTDIAMPVMDGLELLQKLAVRGTPPVVVISARSSQRDEETALELGAKAFLAKPFRGEELLRLVAAELHGGGGSG